MRACVRACEVSATSPPPLQIVMEYCGAGSVADIMRILDRTVSKGGAILDRVGPSLGRGGAVTRQGWGRHYVGGDSPKT